MSEILSRRHPLLASEQDEAVQEEGPGVVMMDVACGIAYGAEIKGRTAVDIKAPDAGEIEAVLLCVAAAAPDASGLEDVVECEDIPEVEAAVVVAVVVAASAKLLEPATVNPVIAIRVEEMTELVKADSAILVNVHGSEEFA
ncbi:hypothetical protein PanWU01x14_298590 [Parasponia andersonii]|uniref:Uncharacterized protein n=1 Tax=Parasponia andersonii TaxID=3476 RepID=A0A2P5AUQ7_PARAD|nr:hypothetical protein PanWU01x14_298590 [Parasponia andersonii]